MTLALAIVASLTLAVQEAPGTVQGVVRDAGDGQPIAGAEIELLGTGRSAVTDEQGRYVLAAVPGGERRLRARRFGFTPLDVDLSVPASGVVSVDFHLEGSAFLLPPVAATVAAAPPAPAPGALAEEQRMPARAVVRVLDASPGVGELGIGAGARALLGPDPPAPDNVLYVRGAGASLDLVLLDGAPVHAPFHLGGLLDPGLPPSVQRAERLQGGVTARYDGGLSDVLLLESRPAGQGVRASAFVDMLATGGTFETAREGVGAISGSFRALHGAWERGLLSSGFPQRYRDALVRADLYPGGGPDTLSLTVYRNEESVRIGEPSLRDEPQWGNTAGSLRYHAATVFGRAELGGAYGTFDTRLPVGSTDPLIATGETRHLRAWADFRRQVGKTWLGYGVQGDRIHLRTLFREATDTEDVTRLRQRAEAGAVALWVEGTRPVLADVDVAAGMRANFFTDGLGSSLSPRLTVGWQVDDVLRVTGSYGRFHQMVVTVDTDLPLESTLVTTGDGRVIGSVLSGVAAARSTHFVLGVTYAPEPRTIARVEAFWKTSSGVPEYGDGALRNAGIDVLASRPLAPNLSLWGAYTLAWAWADFPDAPREEVYSARHYLRGGVTFDAPGELRLDADLSMGQGLEFGAVPRSERTALTPAESETPAAASGSAAVAGGAIAVVPGATRAIRGPLEPGGPIFTAAPEGSYLRLNVQATAEIEVRFFGRTQQLLPYFRIVNALDRRDALFFSYDRTENEEPSPIGSVPILPVVGIEWRL